jgi:3-keto-L-gulonate-6-phosphate decarboxylase
MKLHITFDVADMEHALDVASRIEPYVDGLHIGTQLLFRHGTAVIDAFCKAFPNKDLFVDSKIIDHGRSAAALFGETSVRWISVMAGARKETLHAASTQAREQGRKVIVDLLDARSAGQMALESQSLGASALRFHHDASLDELMLKDRWEMVKGNATIPIMISNIADQNELDRVIQLQPDAIIVGGLVTQSTDPVATVQEIAQKVASAA